MVDARAVNFSVDEGDAKIPLLSENRFVCVIIAALGFMFGIGAGVAQVVGAVFYVKWGLNPETFAMSSVLVTLGKW